MSLSEKQKSLDLALAQITRDFGQGAIMKLGDAGAGLDVEAVSTGFAALDHALGVGGLPRGRIVEIFGPESSGKTTLALHALAAVQRSGGTAAFVDAEHALDPRYARALGCDIDSLLVSQPGSGEEALEITDALVRSAAVDIVVVDSVAALVPRAEIDGAMGEQQMGLQARLMSQALRKLAGSVARSKAIAIFINQLREKIGVMFGNPEVTPGGRALKFYASVRIDTRSGETLRRGDAIIGKMMKVRIVKNKVAPPFREALFEVHYGHGISAVSSLIELGLARGVLEAQGAWIRWGEVSLGQGKDKAREWLIAHPQEYKRLDAAVRAALAAPRDRA